MNMSHATNDAARRHAVHAAAEWLALLADDDSEEQRAAFMTWLRASTLHVEEFLRLSTLERRLRRPAAWPRDSLESLLAAAKAAADVTQLPAPRTKSKSRTTRLRALAAGIALALVAAGAVFTVHRWQATDSTATTTYATELGEQRSVLLPDGSVIELNSRSRLQTSFTERQRQVRLLTGEAIFKVAKNPMRPFTVSVGATDIVAVGTAFNIDAHGPQTVVTVLEGRVRVSGHADKAARALPDAMAAAVELSRGEQIVIDGGRFKPEVAAVDPDKVVAWTQRRLIFEDTPLEAVAAQFARYDTRIIRLGNSSLKERRITGVFDAHDPASLIEFLRTDQDISIETDQQGWKLSSADLVTGSAAVR